jgi:hypothetical protein
LTPGQADPQEFHLAHVDPIGRGHGRIGPGRAHGDADAGRQESIEQQLHGEDRETEKNRIQDVAGNAIAFEHREYRIDTEKRFVGSIHDP